ncbi:sialidase family protein [Streptomyces specialis]|uniref:sialidase family protein n=1 Tax=Streptomyces specialis TaxID=498367 RepID=UPI00073ED2A4|nr:sialidase family protein [Streptomyces specialis]
MLLHSPALLATLLLSALMALWASAPATASPLPPPAASPRTSSPPTSPPPAELSRPFERDTGGYACYRVPAVVTAPDGTLLAFAEARVEDCSDVGHIDLVLRRSADGGRTWEPLTVLAGADDDAGYGNPAPVVDDATGRVTLLFAHNTWTEDADGERIRGPRTLRALHSTDHGATWEAGGDLTALKPEGWTWVSVGPGHGVRLTHGAHAGRLIVPGDHDTGDGRSGAQLYYSDDGGLTWRLGAVHEAPDGEPQPGEPTVAQRPDGTLYVNARSSQTCGTHDHRLAAGADDGGETFAPGGFTPVPDLDAPPVAASLLAVDDGERLLLSAPARPGAEAFEDRRVMAIRTSTDGGATWRETGTVIHPGRAGYSDLTPVAGAEIGLLYETEDGGPHGSIAFTAFTLDALDAAGTDLVLPRTPDESGHDNDAVVHGGAALTADGRPGPAMGFDGADDYLRLIDCPASLDLGDGDFAVSTWFRHEETDGALPLLWGYDDDPGERQFWLRAEPGEGRLSGAIDTGTAAASVSTGAAHNDGGWHHVAFQRQGGQLQLSVDGAAPATADAPVGDISPDEPFTLHIGARPDYTELFRGALDDVRIYGRALTADEWERVRAGATDVPDERVRLPFATLT